MNLHSDSLLKPDSGSSHLRHCLQFLLMMAMLVLASQILAQEISENIENNDELMAQSNASYRLGAGDNLQINVFNQSDLSGEYKLDGNGHFDMHLIGEIEAGNLTADELEALLMSKLKPDYLLNPRVSVQIRNFRPFYIIGEVNSPNSYNYVDGMTYLNAVAIAGGFTYRAKKDSVYVVRDNDSQEKEIKLEISTKVRPGDVIRIAERLF